MYARFLKTFDLFFKIILPIMISALALMISLQTVLRYVFHKPLLFMEELIIIPSLGLYFLGSIWATRNEAHMNARLLEIFIKEKRHIAVIRAISAFFGIGISSWLAYLAYDMLKYSLRVKKVSIVLNYRMTVVECLPFICFIMIAFLMVFELKKYLLIALEKKNTMEEK